MAAAFVAGVGLHPFGRFADKSYRDLGEIAARAALNDAGISFTDVQVAFVANVMAEMAKGSNVLERLGLTGIPIIGVENACASGGSAFAVAVQLVVAGAYDVALALGVEKAPRGFIPESGYDRWQVETGLAVNPIYFALGAHQHMARYGTTREQLAAVSVKNHRHGAVNPNAMFRKELTVDEVLFSRMVCDPLTLLMLCAPNEGAAAAVVVSEGAARNLRLSRLIRVRAASLSSRTAGQFFIPAAGGVVDAGIESSTQIAVNRAYEEAGLGPEDLDLCEVQDTDSASELYAYEDLGLCKPGDSGQLLDSGLTQIGGKLPVNPSGGLLSKGEPLGASALGQVHELVTQLRGRAGPRQVEGARIGLSHTIGAGGNCSVIILST